MAVSGRTWGMHQLLRLVVEDTDCTARETGALPTLIPPSLSLLSMLAKLKIGGIPPREHEGLYS